jgi:hypothetical protein
MLQYYLPDRSHAMHNTVTSRLIHRLNQLKHTLENSRFFEVHLSQNIYFVTAPLSRLFDCWALGFC